MHMSPGDWLDVVRREYLEDFIRGGGAAVKFVVPSEDIVRSQLRDDLRKTAVEAGFQFATVSAETTKIHMIDKLFHEVARQVDWDELAYHFVTQILKNEYELPVGRNEFNLQNLAALNQREEKFLRQELNRYFEQAIYRDFAMSQEFRIGMIRLCQAQLDTGGSTPFLSTAVKEWLRGELRQISALKEALIFQKVARHNGRHMLFSLAHWLRKTGKNGLVLHLDISRYLESIRPSDPRNGFYYSAPATVDAYELLRQFIDGTDELECCFIAVVASGQFLTDERRGVNRYDALKLRIWDDVRDKNRQNPFASMVRLQSGAEAVEPNAHISTRSDGSAGQGSDSIRCRRAIEALRAGVPNRDAVQALQCSQPEIENAFRQQLQSLKQNSNDRSKATGMLVEGGFGTGKSHLLEYLQHLALEENFVCSKIVISKETALYDPVKLYRSAVEAAIAPGKMGAALTEIATQLDFKRQAYADLHHLVNRPGSELNSRFAATLFLFERMNNDQELIARIIRFWSGDPIGVNELKSHLRACREATTYRIDKILTRELALQRFNFLSRLIIAAGYAGWVLLIDEVELIGRYSLAQRARSYAAVARWLGELEDETVPGLTTVLAITDDFHGAVLEEKGDLDKVPGKLRAKGSPQDLLLASQAEKGMRIIERTKKLLQPPDDAMVEQTYDRVRSIHATAYGWDPPPVASGERSTSTRMREYVRGWITEWDLKRVNPEQTVQIEKTEWKPDYTEDPGLLETSEEEETTDA